MWESLQRLVAEGDAWFVLICLFLTLISVRMGLLRYKSEKILFGKDAGETERSIQRSQCEYAYAMCTGFYNKIPHFEEFDTYRAKYIIEICYDEMVTWIYNNHIENKDGYIKNKQDIIWSIVQANVTHNKLTSEKFKKDVDEYIAHIIEHLVFIRGEYK